MENVVYGRPESYILDFAETDTPPTGTYAGALPLKPVIGGLWGNVWLRAFRRVMKSLEDPDGRRDYIAQDLAFSQSFDDHTRAALHHLSLQDMKVKANIHLSIPQKGPKPVVCRGDTVNYIVANVTKDGTQKFPEVGFWHNVTINMLHKPPPYEHLCRVLLSLRRMVPPPHIHLALLCESAVHQYGSP